MKLQLAHKVTPFLWFDTQAEAAVNFYVSLLPNSRICDVTHWATGSPYPVGSVMSASFELDGQQFIAFNGGPHFQINSAFSLFIHCDDQAEVDHYWNAFIADGGTPGRCAWLQDRFGVSWQIVPKVLGQLLSSPDPVRAGRAMQAMLAMSKINIVELERAMMD